MDEKIKMKYLHVLGGSYLGISFSIVFLGVSIEAVIASFLLFTGIYLTYIGLSHK